METIQGDGDMISQNDTFLKGSFFYWVKERSHVQKNNSVERWKRAQQSMPEVRDKQMSMLKDLFESTKSYNIVADGWAGASNPHPHPKPHSIHKHT